MKALVGAFNQEKVLVGAFSVIIQPVVEPMDRFTALLQILHNVWRRHWWPGSEWWPPPRPPPCSPPPPPASRTCTHSRYSVLRLYYLATINIRVVICSSWQRVDRKVVSGERKEKESFLSIYFLMQIVVKKIIWICLLTILGHSCTTLTLYYCFLLWARTLLVYMG